MVVHCLILRIQPKQRVIGDFDGTVALADVAAGHRAAAGDVYEAAEDVDGGIERCVPGPAVEAVEGGFERKAVVESQQC